AVLDAVAGANREVRALTDDTAVIAGTTLAAVVAVTVDDPRRPRWMVVHVGDSRVYAWDGIVLERLTSDHSLVQELQDAGVIDAAGAENHPDRNVVTRALGAADDVDPGVLLLGAGDSRDLLICSDGLTKELTDDRIAALLAAGGDADALVAAAVAAGGRDNVSVVLVHPEFTGLAADGPNEQTAEHGADEQTRERLHPDGDIGLEDTRPRA
ncbi:MAG TPA: serine/threonine-protein phosphatase, partial [Pseudolysinimonas sp.]|nr:serine/threonine-protein phosphatase [Pseudolysinimonas sp.]